MCGLKAGSEEELHRLGEEQKKLNLQAKIVRALIQEMKQRNRRKRLAVNHLQARIRILEAQVSTISVPDTPEK